MPEALDPETRAKAERDLAAAAAAGIHCIPVPTPFAVGRVNCYLIEDDPLTLVDAGPRSGRSFEALAAGIRRAGHAVEDVGLMVVTHQHIDHIGLVGTVAERSGAEVVALGAAADYLAHFTESTAEEDDRAVRLMMRHGVPEQIASALKQVTETFREWGSPVRVTRPVDDGEKVELADRTLEVFHRPGHSPSDTVFWDAERKLLISGDHLLSHISSNPLISRPLDGGPGRTRSLIDYLASLEKTREMPAEMVLSGHGVPITDHVALIDRRFAGKDRRLRKIHGLIEEEPRTAHALAEAIWGNVAVTQAFLTLSEVIGHIDILEEEGKVREVRDGEKIKFEAVG